MFKDRIEKAKVLLEALPYIKSFMGRPLSLNMGGLLWSKMILSPYLLKILSY